MATESGPAEKLCFWKNRAWNGIQGTGRVHNGPHARKERESIRKEPKEMGIRIKGTKLVNLQDHNQQEPAIMAENSDILALNKFIYNFFLQHQGSYAHVRQR